MGQAKGFRARLAARQEAVNSLVCVGLDPVVEKIPPHIRAACTSDATAALLWMQGMVDATYPYASLFKPQFAHWFAIPDGLRALEVLNAYIRLRYPDIPQITDGKPGDIDRTQEKYRDGHFGVLGAQALNPNGYMGKTTLKNLIDPKDPGRAIVGLGRTSNPEAWEVQDAMLAEGIRVWERQVILLQEWSTEFGILENAGVVMGAAHRDPNIRDNVYSWHLSRFREIVDDRMWALIPGIGTQGGFVQATVGSAYRGPGSIAINSSSGITNASGGYDCFEVAAQEAKKLRDDINQYR